MLTTGLQTVGLGGKVGATMTKPTGNEDRAPAGMKKKWQQHYQYGKWIQLGKTLCQVYSGSSCKAEFLGTGITSSILYICSNTVYFCDALDQSHATVVVQTSLGLELFFEFSVFAVFFSLEWTKCHIVVRRKKSNLKIGSNGNDVRAALVAVVKDITKAQKTDQILTNDDVVAI